MFIPERQSWCTRSVVSAKLMLVQFNQLSIISYPVMLACSAHLAKPTWILPVGLAAMLQRLNLKHM